MTVHEQAIQIPVEHGNIAGTIVTPGTTLPGVLFVHGWGGSQQQYVSRATETAALGCVCLTFDLTGHAATRSEQKTVSRETNLQDVLAAYDTLAAHPWVDSDAIAVVGSSYGAYLAAILTSLRPVRWLCMRVPALYMDSDWDLPKQQLRKEQHLEAYRQRIVPAEENRALRAAAAFEGDVLLVESERDRIIPHPVVASYLRAFLDARSLTYRVIEGADHGLSDETAQRAYTALLMHWLHEMVSGLRAGNHAGAAARVA
jgi:pimeloyl-ACP methyl ester carboxylesterase